MTLQQGGQISHLRRLVQKQVYGLGTFLGGARRDVRLGVVAEIDERLSLAGSPSRVAGVGSLGRLGRGGAEEHVLITSTSDGTIGATFEEEAATIPRGV